MKKYRMIIIFGILLSLIIISLRRVLFIPGLVGFIWDWPYPPYAEQVLDLAKNRLWIWNDIISLGQIKVIMPELYFDFIIGLPALLGITGEWIIKLFLVFSLFMGGAGMLFLARKLRFTLPTSFLCAVYYMFSPLFYSRIVAGHLNIVMGYALIPFFIGFLMGAEDNNKWLENTILGGITFSLMSSHISLIVVNILILLIFITIDLIRRRRLKGIYIGIIILAIFVLLHSWWLIYFIKVNFGGLTQFPGGRTVEEISVEVLESIKGAGASIWDAIRLYTSAGLGTEYVFPAPPSVKQLWDIVSYALPGFIFLGLLAGCIKKKIKYWIIYFIVILLFGICLCNGIRNPLGHIVYKLMAKVPPILALFTRVFRFGILISLGYAVLLGFTLEIYKSWFRKCVYLAYSALILIYILPFLSGRITEPLMEGTQPLCLQVNKISPDDRKLYDYLKNSHDDYRVSYLPPAQLSYVGETEHTFEWTLGSSPKPEFIGVTNSDRYYNLFMISCLFQPRTVSTYLSKLFGLANIKYIIFPSYKEYFTYLPFGHLQNAELPEILYKAKGKLENLLEKQENLVFKTDLTEIKGITIYENKDCLPHIYPVNEVIISSGDFAGLIGLSYLQDFSFADKAIFYASRLNSSQYRFLCDLSPSYLIYNNNIIDFLLPYLDNKFIIYPGYYCKIYFYNWSNMAQGWDEDWHYGTTIIKSKGARTQSAAKLDFDLNVDNASEYELYIQAHKSPEGSSLAVYLDGRLLNEIVTQDSLDRGFQWVHCGSLYINKGKHGFYIESKPGKNAVNCIIAVPKYIIEKANRELEKDMQDKEIILLYETEEVCQNLKGEGLIEEGPVELTAEINKDTPNNGLNRAYSGFSNGRAVKLPVDLDLNIPIDGEYNIFLRAKFEGETSVILRGEGFSINKIFFSSEGFGLHDLGKIKLNKGLQKMNIASDKETILDILVLKRDIVSADFLGNPIKFNYKKMNPTKYKINVTASKPVGINFIEAFDPNWRITIDNKHAIADSLPLFGFANFYYIKLIGEHEIILEYSNQKYFKIGQLITLFSWGILLLLVIVLKIRK